jgi:hypothetical protein
MSFEKGSLFSLKSKNSCLFLLLPAKLRFEKDFSFGIEAIEGFSSANQGDRAKLPLCKKNKKNFI